MRLTYDRAVAGAPPSVVVKISSSDALYRKIGDFYHAYDREFAFYAEIAGESPIRLPQCFARVHDGESSAHVLVLEDLGALDAGDEAAGMTPVEAVATVETIGRFHAYWWESPKSAATAWMPQRNLSPARYRAAWPKFREVIAPLLPASAAVLGDFVHEHVETLLDSLERPPHTIAHSDFRADNLLFDRSSTQDPVVVVDWQLAIRSRGIMDVARLVCGSLHPGDRAAHEGDLLARWHDALLAGGVKGYSLTQARDDYRKAVLLCLYYPVTIHEAEEAAGKRGCALAHAQIERYFRAADDHRADVVL
jgi:hypothetical protein